MSLSRSPDDLIRRVQAMTELLDAIAADWSLLDALPADARERLHRAVAAVYNPDPVARRRRVKAGERQRKADAARHDDRVLHETGIRSLRRKPTFTTPNVYPPTRAASEADSDARSTSQLRHCYICKQKYAEIHHFYDQLCPTCADLNYAKRSERANLSGRVALVTGGRVKIGYQAGLKLLRCGVHLIVTTRFPRDSASRYAQEADFEDWADRLEIHGLDLRHTPSVEAFCRGIADTHSRLDFIINNACQTVRRPPAFYEHMMAGERAVSAGMAERVRHLLGARDRRELPPRGIDAVREPAKTWASAGVLDAAELSQVPLLAEELLGQNDLFPAGLLDPDLQQVDLRGRNSWRLLLAEVSSVELLEVQLINAIAPFLLNARLKALMCRTPERDKHIVNVSAVEGQFYRNFKTTRHPHTNMAKAALNMMTRTSATDYHDDGIHMNSVDTGWVTDEDPEVVAARKTLEQRFHPPLDVVDGAARILDPIISGFNSGRHVWGQFLKDYAPTDW